MDLHTDLHVDIRCGQGSDDFGLMIDLIQFNLEGCSIYDVLNLVEGVNVKSWRHWYDLCAFKCICF